MGRPKKSEMGPVPTKERLYHKALELFAKKGFEAVSVREITKSLGLNEASLYNHFKNKAALLEEIINRFESKLVEPGFKKEMDHLPASNQENLAENLIKGGLMFFEKTDTEVMLVWRMLMISQYNHSTAKECLENLILTPPIEFFSNLVTQMQKKGRVRQNVDSRAAGRIIASIFFDYSFRSNLESAWNEHSQKLLDNLKADLTLFANSLES